MQTLDRDRDIIEHMLRYCRQIETAHNDFDHSKTRFLTSTTYQNAIALCILQIGELSNHLSESFKTLHSDIPWKKIRGMRNYVAHEYGAVDPETLWFTSTNSIRELSSFCEAYLTS